MSIYTAEPMTELKYTPLFFVLCFCQKLSHVKRVLFCTTEYLIRQINIEIVVFIHAAVKLISRMRYFIILLILVCRIDF